MAIRFTSPQRITTFQRSSTQIVLIFSRPFAAPLFLGSISMARGSAGSAVSGRVVPGTGPNTPPGGSAPLQVGVDLFNFVTGLLGPPTQSFTVQLKYDDVTLLVSDLVFTVGVGGALQRTVHLPGVSAPFASTDSEPPPSGGDDNELDPSEAPPLFMGGSEAIDDATRS